ncbi:DNA gyrase inhibitor YacG [Myxococcota bacterium]|nr:DNA gyrase inhibitor YacG [Myxococcota bacterium]
MLGVVSRKCPICKKPVEEAAPTRPFCSTRCKDVDLGKWLGEEYRITRPMTPEEIVQSALEDAKRRPGDDEDDVRRDVEYDA